MKHMLFGILALLAVPLILAAVDINTTTAAELETLPGIGPAKAKAIVTYRQQDDQFKMMGGLEKVKGIGEDISSKLKDEMSMTPPAAKKAVPAMKQQ